MRLAEFLDRFHEGIAEAVIRTFPPQTWFSQGLSRFAVGWTKL